MSSTPTASTWCGWKASLTPPLWGTEAFPVKTSYVAGDTIGVFAVDANGKVTKANKAYRYNGTSWIGIAANDTLLYNPTSNYYLYYPYRKDLKGARTAGSSFTTNPSAANVEDDFFSDVISQWTVSTDQSTSDKLLANDLQIAKATAGSGILKIKATMKHAMGLANITLGTAIVGSKTRFYKYANNTTNTTEYTDVTNTTGTITASNVFNGVTPYPSAATNYYYITKAGSTVDFTSPTTGDGRWANQIVLTIASGESAAATANVESSGVTVYYKGWYFECTKSTATLPVSAGSYKLEVWGAAGGYGKLSNTYAYGGKGGYATGDITISSATNLYVVVGGAGGNSTGSSVNAAGGYNGGPYAQVASGGTSWGAGGGATHIAWNVKYDLLLNYVNNQNDVLIVAGAGGGGGIFDYANTGGAGGGEEGTDGAGVGPGYKGTQTAGGSGQLGSQGNVVAVAKGGFGYGGGYYNTSKLRGSTGGAGWYGGGCGFNTGSAGGGGSGHINKTYLKNYSMQTGVRSGDGYARITHLTPVAAF